MHGDDFLNYVSHDTQRLSVSPQDSEHPADQVSDMTEALIEGTTVIVPLRVYVYEPLHDHQAK